MRNCSKNSLRDNFSKGQASSCGQRCSSQSPTFAHWDIVTRPCISLAKNLLSPAAYVPSVAIDQFL